MKKCERCNELYISFEEPYNCKCELPWNYGQEAGE